MNVSAGEQTNESSLSDCCITTFFEPHQTFVPPRCGSSTSPCERSVLSGVDVYSSLLATEPENRLRKCGNENNNQLHPEDGLLSVCNIIIYYFNHVLGACLRPALKKTVFLQGLSGEFKFLL